MIVATGKCKRAAIFPVLSPYRICSRKCFPYIEFVNARELTRKEA